MKEPVWVLREVVIAVHQSLLAEHSGALGIRDEPLLDSALNRPRQRFESTDEPSLFDFAASYCYGLANNHPFVDGNKRIALTIAAMFLELNGYTLDAPEPNTVVIIEGLAAGNISEEDLSSWFGEFSISNT
ncbi:MAG: type II toxin-antitoxin system death-on-curing family toxin [Candidatus Thiodiazotropha sp.]